MAQTKNRGDGLTRKFGKRTAGIFLCKRHTIITPGCTRCSGKPERVLDHQRGKMLVIFRRIDHFTTQDIINGLVIKAFVRDFAINSAVSIAVRRKRLEQRCTATAGAT